jgi:hypothetical protein
MVLLLVSKKHVLIQMAPEQLRLVVLELLVLMAVSTTVINAIAMQDLLEFPQQMDQPRVSNKRVRTLTVQVQLLHVVVVQHVQTTV